MQVQRPLLRDLQRHLAGFWSRACARRNPLVSIEPLGPNAALYATNRIRFRFNSAFSVSSTLESHYLVHMPFSLLSSTCSAPSAVGVSSPMVRSVVAHVG